MHGGGATVKKAQTLDIDLGLYFLKQWDTGTLGVGTSASDLALLQLEGKPLST